MGGVTEMITGRGAKRQARLAEDAQARQEAQLAEEKRKLKAVEDGQIANARTGGTGGLLAYVDRAKSTEAELAEKIGGSGDGTIFGEMRRRLQAGQA